MNSAADCFISRSMAKKNREAHDYSYREYYTFTLYTLVLLGHEYSDVC